MTPTRWSLRCHELAQNQVLSLSLELSLCVTTRTPMSWIHGLMVGSLRRIIWQRLDVCAELTSLLPVLPPHIIPTISSCQFIGLNILKLIWNLFESDWF